MNVGRLVPRSNRPDFSTMWTNLHDIPPRRFILNTQLGDGSWVEPWLGLTTLSSVFEVSADGQSIIYNWTRDELPGSRYELVYTVFPFDNGSTVATLVVRTRWNAYQDDDLIAFQQCQGGPVFYSWDEPFPDFFRPNCSPQSWTRFVPTSVFGNSVFRWGAAGWDWQPEYEPYRTRPS